MVRHVLYTNFLSKHFIQWTQGYLEANSILIFGIRGREVYFKNTENWATNLFSHFLLWF